MRGATEEGGVGAGKEWRKSSSWLSDNFPDDKSPSLCMLGCVCILDAADLQLNVGRQTIVVRENVWYVKVGFVWLSIQSINQSFNQKQEQKCDNSGCLSVILYYKFC
eukprot:TRINITY_DN1395_c0_g3_i2.p1 TRINITY_DN1395_c0_g3~~TRINITY_DN1395_c0_g3_i2.p1  ORF type:complete len:107 (-),score=10.33 TRINITY_DN1395_c0_g3_i2:62-382(-)